MDPELHRAWTEIITAEDYEEHMASIGQAQAAAELTHRLIESASLRPGSRITIAGAGTGQMFDFLVLGVFGPHRLTCADLNPVFLARLRERLERHGLEAEILEDDIERTALTPRPDLLLARCCWSTSPGPVGWRHSPGCSREHAASYCKRTRRM